LEPVPIGFQKKLRVPQLISRCSKKESERGEASGDAKEGAQRERREKRRKDCLMVNPTLSGRRQKKNPAAPGPIKGEPERRQGGGERKRF